MCVDVLYCLHRRADTAQARKVSPIRTRVPHSQKSCAIQQVLLTSTSPLYWELTIGCVCAVTAPAMHLKPCCNTHIVPRQGLLRGQP